ncbi:MAG TPA: molybdopterin dinucleotide binding domain-containing protein [Thermoanaerobaculia bacterium]|nr:molybdopterin dinucleotide binding domain-containing protein [Thermoanaerobaculia bacterium]
MAAIEPVPVTDEEPLTIEHAGVLGEQHELPRYVMDGATSERSGQYSCSFCGVGDGGVVSRQSVDSSGTEKPPAGAVIMRVEVVGGAINYPAIHDGNGRFDFTGLTPASVRVSGKLIAGGKEWPAILNREDPSVFRLPAMTVATTRSAIGARSPTAGCVKLNTSMGSQRPLFPIHIQPSVLDQSSGRRRAISYEDAIERLADLLLTHRPPDGRTLIYACGQVDYFTIFAFQEVFRLLGVTNLAGNAEHCLNAGAVHNEMLTGQEGPFLTIEQAVDGPNRFYLLNGWNGLITHPPVFHSVLKRKDLDAYLVEVAITESADTFVKKLGEDRLLLIRSGSDPQLALAVAHEILRAHPAAVDARFLQHYGDDASFEKFTELARSDDYDADRAAARIAAEPQLGPRIANGIRAIAARLADPAVIPINIPSVGLSQTKGAVAHALWGSVLGMVGKYGLRSDGTPAGGTLRIPGQINAETEVQGLSRRIFMGRIRRDAEGAVEAARRMRLPDHAYDMALNDTARAALDYSDPVAEEELFLFFGTQFESNMMERSRWIEKLQSGKTRFVVIDPIPDPYSVANADLIIPSPPHSAATKLYQNGEWRLTLSFPQRVAAWETRTDPTVVYDAMSVISRRLRGDATLRSRHPDLGALSDSGYLAERFEPPALPRIDGEVSRSHLWERVIDYFSGGSGPLYCRPDHADGTPIRWSELVEQGVMIHGGVGENRYRLDYDDPNHFPFRDIYRRPRKFTFFTPTEEDLRLPEGIILNSGRTTLSDDRARIRFAVSTFNSGKATPGVDMPDENPLHVSPLLAGTLGIRTGEQVTIRNRETGAELELAVVVNDRCKGSTVYVSFHKSKAEVERGVYLNDLTSHHGRCPYTAQSNFKATLVTIEKIAAATTESFSFPDGDETLRS